MSIRKLRSALALCCCLPLLLAPTVSAQTGEPAYSMSGADILKLISAQETPIGFEALAIYKRLRGAPFQQNVQFSNKWIQSHIDHYDKSRDARYRADVKDMIDGGGDVQLGMRQWLTDPKNVAWWDNAIRTSAGEDGYARVVALNAAFAPGSNNYRMTYGGTRLFDPDKNVIKLNGTSRPGLAADRMMLKFDPAASNDVMFGRMVKFGDSVRQQMFNFYEAYAAKRVTPAQVRAFNEGYILSGGCALAATNALELNRIKRYVNALNLMANTLGELGFKVQP